MMLEALKHRGSRHVIEPVLGGRRKIVDLGCVSHPGTVQDIMSSDLAVAAVNGSFYLEDEKGVNHVLRQVQALGFSKALRKVPSEIGGFAGLAAKGDAIYAFRDINGLSPLYYGRSRGVTAFASERKALWRIGLMSAHAVPPGAIVSSVGGRLAIGPVVQFRPVHERDISFEQASAILRDLLSESMRRITSKVGKLCVAFSGGLDSAVTAALAKNAGFDVEAISVGLEGSSEISSVEHYARQLGLHITLDTFDIGSIEEYVRRLLWLIEEPNMMKLSVAIPLHWAAKVGSRRGCSVMLCGQGSDELYGGYKKYANILRTKGRRALRAQLYRSVVESSQVNYERDDQATSPFPIELRTPFADPDLIRFSLTIPSEFKVKEADDVTRKWILRDVAKTIGVPEEMIWRRKKAIQHGTGVEKAIIKLAKSRGLRPDEYLSTIYEEIRRLESMP
jgi:asparagine synthase (glutamine-hydrolysing)